MPTLPWTLLLSKLRSSDAPRMTHAEVVAAGANPSELIRLRLLHPNNDYERAECEHQCEPNLDFDTRKDEGLVGVACPNDPACWPGWDWVPRDQVESLSCRLKDVLAALARASRLAPLDEEIPPPFEGIGWVKRRGLTTAVVWMRSARTGFLQLCRGLRAQLSCDALIVLMPKSPPTQFLPSDRIQVMKLRDSCGGVLDLTRPLDELVPDYRTRVLTDSELELDYVTLRFATRPGERHVLEINGHDFGAFRKSDVKFLRLLLLASARKYGQDDGWVDKVHLRGSDDKDRDLEKIRSDLAMFDVPGLSEAERKALIKSRKRSGTVRLAVPAENIVLDESLATLRFVSVSSKADGQRPQLTKKQEQGIHNAVLLVQECRRLGVTVGSADSC